MNDTETKSKVNIDEPMLCKHGQHNYSLSLHFSGDVHGQLDSFAYMSQTGISVTQTIFGLTREDMVTLANKILAVAESIKE